MPPRRTCSELGKSFFTNYTQAFFASQFMWAISIASFRLAMLDFYTRTFATYKFCLVARGLMVIVILFFIGSITTTLRMCVPISYNWDSSIDGACGDLAAGELAAAAFNLVLDVVIVLLPCRIIWGLQMSVRKKAAVSATFGLSLIISGINLARIIEVLVCDLADFTYCTANAMILTVAEPAVGIIVVCVPTLGPIIFPERRERFVKAYRPSHYGSHNTHMDLTDADRWRRVSWTSSRNGLVRDQMQGEIPRTDRSGDLHEVSVPTGVEGGLQDHYEMTDRVKGIQWDPV
ncbi:hypothetical protein BDV09DRAFT_179595 [Aspergillus tetrazonus]